MSIFAKLWAFLTRQEIIYLEDFDGDIVKTFARKTITKRLAKRHWPFDIHTVVLEDGGTIGNRSYVKRWFK